MSDKTIQLTKQEFANIKQLQLQGMRLEQRKSMIPIEREAMEAQHQGGLESLETELSQIPVKQKELTERVSKLTEAASARSGD